MAVSEIIAQIIAILALGAAVQNFFLVPLVWKLIGLAVGGLVIVRASSSALRKWARPRPTPGFLQPASRRSKLSAALAILGVFCFVFALIAYTVVRYNGIHVDVGIAPERKVAFWFHGAAQGADLLTIDIPPAEVTQCAPIDPFGGARYRADAQLIDWNTPNPRLQLSNFFYPQLVGVQCTPPVGVEQLVVRVEPTSIEVFFPDRTYFYNMGILVAGGLLWIVAIWFLFSSPS